MIISLKSARRIERRIQEKAINNGYDLHANIDIYTQFSISEDIKLAEISVKNNIINAIDLINARSNIRRLIQETNETSGINELISNRESSIKILAIWESVNQVDKEIKPVSVIERRVEAKLNRVKNGNDNYYSTSRSETVEFTAVSDNLYDFSVLQVREIQTQIDDCDDKLASLNATTKIKISDAIVELLHQNSII